MSSDGQIFDAGEIVEAEPPRRLVIRWQHQNKPELKLRDCEPKGLVVDPAQASYFLSHATVVATGGRGMPVWRERLFSVMVHNIGNIAAYFKLTANRVIELGSRVEI